MYTTLIDYHLPTAFYYKLNCKRTLTFFFTAVSQHFKPFMKKKLKMKVKVAQSCLILCNTMGDIVHEILQVRILLWIAVPFSRESSQSKD